VADDPQIHDDFVAMVTHELRTPLTAVQGGAAVLREHWKDLPPDTIEELLAGIDRQATRMNALISNLLELSRLDRGTLRIEVVPVRLREVIDAAVHRAEKRDSIVEVDVGDNTVAVADAMRLRRVVEELVTNAAGSGATRVNVSSTVADGEVELAVADDGPGVPQAVEERLFGRFVRGTTGDGLGWGLGLAVARGLTEAQGGRITYAPNQPAGARFVVTLPAG
jgi:two-component system, OmpR family, sensor histidine kinase KdpD